MTETEKEIVVIDVCGQICPSSLLTALREINQRKNELRDGKLQLDIITDNHDSINRIAEAVSNMGYQVSLADQGKQFRISICKTDGAIQK
ncbi:Sulfurtransferase TusA [Malonomonas rubra DSM 5091]|uniref:Sulfurtransferase TusA n=1 Tax=Malonomonas rubra DSM 5091 TaxID=1122189 RepID=A0A1M6C4M6_MALRU|nr:sulfurtransferase TusA family protein [Malonomonas rubra]SHI55987.1 Sulfurtransferase TusA [Malonomonas rubra DSM 5091]